MIKQSSAFAALLLVVFGFIQGLTGQVEMPPDKVKCEFTISQDGCEATLIAKITMVEHWHINSIVLPEGTFGYATSLNFDASSDYKKVGAVREPKAVVELDEASQEMISYHNGTVYFKQKIKVVSEKDFQIKGSFSYQTCDESKCLMPYTEDFTIKVKGCSEEDVSQTEIEKNFIEEKDGIAKDKDGTSFVKVNDQWHEVPKGNSAPFYKKYLTLVDNDEK